MKTIDIKKIFQGAVSVRDYIVEKCIKKNEILRICHEGKFMTLSPEDLKNKKYQITKKRIFSKYKGSYYLYDFLFKPDEKIEQGLLF